QGNEHLAAASLLHGADGLVPGLANVAPALFVAVRRTAAAGDAAGCARLHQRILDLATIYEQGGGFLAALKAACAVIGIGDGRPAVPGAPVAAEQRDAIAAILGRNGIGRRMAVG